MLSYLKVKDLALLEDIKVEFYSGLNLLTGETGVGKSLIVDALQFLIGGKAQTEIIREGKEAAIVEGVFNINNNSKVNLQLQALGIPFNEQLILRREIHRDKKHKYLANDSPITLNTLKKLGMLIVDIFGQLEHQSLLQQESQLEYLDVLCKHENLLNRLNQLTKRITDIKNDIKSLQLDERTRAQKLDYLNFQIKEIKEANLKLNEEEELLAEYKILTNYEKLLFYCNNIVRMLSEKDTSILSSLSYLLKQLDELNHLSRSFSDYIEQIKPFKYILNDLHLCIENYLNGIQFSSERLTWVEQRLDKIEKLKKKYGSSIEQILKFLKEAEQEKEKLEGYQSNIEQLQAELKELLKEYEEIAKKVSEKRIQEARNLEESMRKILPELAMERCKFSASVRRRMLPLSLGEETLVPEEMLVSEKGIDECEFMIEPNPGEGMHSLSKIASGGELSRLMLALKCCGNVQDLDKTLIFDEIDKGIGGTTAEVIGRKLKELSKKHQVICVTHLPQIAAYADHHYVIDKKIQQNRTVTFIKKLDYSERIKEIARMLGSKTSKETALKHAEALLKSAASVEEIERK